MRKVLLVTFSDNADHQDTLFGMYEEMRNRKDWDAYLLCINTPKVNLKQSDHTWLVDCPKRPGVTKKTFNFPLLLSIIYRIRKKKFDAIYFESLHTWNLPIMMMSGKARTYQVIHEVIPHEGDSPVIVFAIIVAFNLQNEEQLNGKVFLTETVVGLLLYYFCRARTAGIILGMYIILLVLFRNEKRLSKVVAVSQYLFLIFAIASIAIAVLFHSRTAIWYQINNVLSGRPWAWDLYFTRYGIHFLGQRIDLTIAALDNAYLRLLIQYGLLTFIAYSCLFVKISRYAYINGKVVLFFSVIAYELYFMAEFGPILINFCPVLMYEATLLINRMQSGE